MNNKEQIWAVLLGVGAVTLGSLVFVYRKAIKKTISSFKNKLVKVANEEWNAWNSEGKIKEGDNRTMDRLRSYWREGGDVNWSDKKMIDEAWSSAFISYLMQKGGAGDEFPKTVSHSVYIREAVKNRKENNTNPFKAYRIDEPEAKVQVGDLVCYPRQSGATYDTTGAYMSHCDLVTEIKGDEAITIGGNVSNSVTKTIVPINSEGFIDRSRDKKGYGGYFTVIKNKK